jgi:uncharacterized protein (DUF1330 family)
MLRHVVIWKMMDFADGHSREENIQRVKEALEALPVQIPGLIRHLEVGVNGMEGVENADLILILDFDDLAALKTYYKHPAHLMAAELLRKVREGRMAIDFESS